MDIHKNVRLVPHRRADPVRRLLAERRPPKAMAPAFGVGVTTVNKWSERFHAEGPSGLIDRSSWPRQ